MSIQSSPQNITEMSRLNPEQRLKYTLKEIVKHKIIWILTDKEGCMMMTVDEDDGIPIWPNQTLAEQWAVDDWKHCEAQPISLEKWCKDWTAGMIDDELAVIVFPSQDEEGIVLFADEFEYEIKSFKLKAH